MAVYYNWDKETKQGGTPPEIVDDTRINGVVDCIHKVIIEKDVFTGHDVMILTGGHDYSKFGQERMRVGAGGPVTIKEGVWIGTRAIILGPTTIGEHSVIGAGSVVPHKNIPAYELWAGNPAKCIKRYDKLLKRWYRI